MNKILKDISFYIISIIHILIWIFVIFSFLNKKTAHINLYYVIPFIFFLHMFPFHILNNAKKSLYPTNWEKKANKIQNKLLVGIIFDFLKDIFKNSFASPFSPQGMLILGSITSAYRLKLI